MPNGFDVNAARQAGYSDDDILAHLTQSRNFDVQNALNSGYSKADVINYLASTPAQPSGPNLYTGQGMMQYSQNQAKQATQQPIQNAIQQQNSQLAFLRRPGASADEQMSAAAADPTTRPGMERMAKAAIATPVAALAPEALPEMGPAASWLLGAAATGAGAGGGTMLGQAAFGQNPLSKPSLKETGLNAGVAGGASLALGALPFLRSVMGDEPGNALASKVRFPATARQSQIGRPGAVKNVLPAFLQRYTLPDWIFPKGDLGTPTNPGWFSDVPAKMPTPQPELGTPDNPGLYAKIPTQMPQSTPELGSPENPGLYAKIPSRMPSDYQAAQSSAPGVRPGRGGIVSPDSPPTAYKTTYQSYPADQLVEMAKRGDMNAIRELIRNPRGVDLSQIPNVRYMLEPGAGRLPWRNYKP